MEKKVRVTDAEFLAVVRASLCNKLKRDGTHELSAETKELAKKICASKNKSKS